MAKKVSRKKKTSRKKKATKKKAAANQHSPRVKGKKTGLTASEVCRHIFKGNEAIFKSKKLPKTMKIKGSPLAARKKPMTDEEIKKFLKEEFPNRTSPDQLDVKKLRWFYTAGHWPKDDAPASSRPSFPYDASGKKMELLRRGGEHTTSKKGAKKKRTAKKKTHARKK